MQLATINRNLLSQNDSFHCSYNSYYYYDFFGTSVFKVYYLTPQAGTRVRCQLHNHAGIVTVYGRIYMSQTFDVILSNISLYLYVH